MRVQQLIEDDLNNRSAKQANKSTLVARGTDIQLGSSCVSAPLTTNVDLWKPIEAHVSWQLALSVCFTVITWDSPLEACTHPDSLVECVASVNKISNSCPT